MKILAFAATNSRQSINKQLVTHAAKQLQQTTGAELEILDLNDFEMPIYSVDREQESGIPEPAQTFFKKVGEADAVLISFGEFNGSFSVAYKNVFDWASRIDQKVYQNKPVCVMATSPGPGGAQSVLAAAVGSAPYFAMDVKAQLSVPSFYDNFDVEKGELSNAELSAALTEALATLA
ncbi:MULTISPECIES: NADPH-dependent FMN reductase [unclassified Oceanobacter]|jgi:NAD(P)H-dependent FMN reductase|uniref:NADPH-dependent FMN reductase n=1 Tax=unclassified Oceanobacter TaxID=2620260 RepID=UPI0026E40B22|nr:MULTISPECIES: NAD(P)H-dependent oxidoreductase [unclassified Oceanobacter]MDO6682679.1 NAD(P)H-dependent oxidoreductase [Oceanobacter sp. 5_MG-2023]MDP2505814.1 NAD(P)H-dependent oxidoreductase [Oceanobacter sp. 3_MG-2023]MDP2549347.1 NAD(P)H-dependent oxidoreductase [Oceanobacter sp. 4_MG-2023]MDP2609102.1 NAD(P)H-dependent oxidoreductase [Oceanobacter sp. 1_MG-2023]MDP2612424.1 NAD(P)H-dependent oxidoreductase [Oceanobacter sp. 2_MG-2023]